MKLADITSEKERIIEEAYACRLVGRDVRVTFNEGDYSYTDGHLITVNPFLDGMYKNTEAIRQTEDELHLAPVFSYDEVKAAKLIGRLQLIHECLRAKYIEIPTRVLTDELGTDFKAKDLLEIINQIIEDAYIENVGATISKTLRQYLRFYRLLMKNCSNIGNLVEEDGFFHSEFEREQTGKLLRYDPLKTYLEYMAIYMLYPMVKEDVPLRIKDYFENTVDFFLSAATTSDPEKRYEYVDKIYRAVWELIKEAPGDISGGGLSSNSDHNEGAERKTDTNYPENGKSQDREILDRILGKSRTHKDAEMADAERKKNPEKGNSSGSLFDRNEELGNENNNFYHSENLINIDLESIPRSLERTHERIDPKVLGCSSMHYDITLNVVKPDKGIARISDYNEVKAKYRSIINMYRSRISEYLQVEDDIIESKCLVGTSIDSSRLADRNKRYWKRVKRGDTLPKLAFIFMIDCSYSMEGFRMKAAKDAMVIINEVLTGQDIMYSVFGHEAKYMEPIVEHNLCLDFKNHSSEKYNLMTLEPGDNSREGISLLWANDYMKKNCGNRERVLVVISDGAPIHLAGRHLSCKPPESVIDAAACVKKIEKDGTKIVAIALEGEKEPCYDKLCNIYSNVIECRKLSSLPKQILEVVAREISSRRM